MTETLKNSNYEDGDNLRLQYDEVSSLGDSHPMNQADIRKKRRQQRLILQVAVFSAVALMSLFGSILNQQLSDYSTGMKHPQIEQNVVLTSANKTFYFNRARNDHIYRTAQKLTRAFPPVSPNVWCIDARLKYEQAKRRPMGLCYLKIPRAASSTLSGINQRIARNFAKRNGLKKTCIRHDGNVAGPYYQLRDSLSFLWTFVRKPTNRAMSRIGHSIRKKGVILHNTSSLGNYSSIILKALETSDDVHYGTISAGRGGFQMQYTMLNIIEEYANYNFSTPGEVVNPKQVQRNVADVVNKYNFLGVVERFDESLVALQLLLGLEASDILYFAVKQKEQYQIAGGNKEGRCQKPLNWNVLLDKEVREYLEGDVWFAQNYGDKILYEVANLSLDQTITSLGLKEFSQALNDFRALLERARTECQPIFPCSANGTLQYEDSLEDCLEESKACGYGCLDQLVASYNGDE